MSILRQPDRIFTGENIKWIYENVRECRKLTKDQNIKKEAYQKIVDYYYEKGFIGSRIDTNGNEFADERQIVGDQGPSLLFFLMAKRFSYLFESSPEVITSEGMKDRKKLWHILKILRLLPMCIIEDKCRLLTNTDSGRIVYGYNEYLKGLKAKPGFYGIKESVIKKRVKYLYEHRKDHHPDKNHPGPVLYAGNHGFKDDAISMLLTARKQNLIFFGSDPILLNSLDGLLAILLNGVIAINRQVKESRQASVKKAESALKRGISVSMMVEGIWNKTANAPVLDPWPGIYKIAISTNTPVYTITLYRRELEKGLLYFEPKEVYRTGHFFNPIRIVVDGPFFMKDFISQEHACRFLKENMGMYICALTEKYGRNTRKRELYGYKNFHEYAEDKVRRRVDGVTRYYNSSIETDTCVDYRVVPSCEEIWSEIANIDIDKILEQYSNLPKDEYVKKAGIVRNIYESKKYANTCLNESKRSDYQHMY